MRVSDSDPRSIRTQTLLRKAMLRLAAENGFASLSVQDVAQEAGLNRTTFYLHYTGLHELLEDCTRTLFEQMRAEIYANPIPIAQRDLAYLAPYAESVFRHLEQYEKFYRTMLGKHGDPLFRGLFQEMLSELIFEPIIERKASAEPDPHLEMILRFFSAGFAGVAAWWLEKGKPISIQQASLLIVRDILPDYLRLMND